MAMRTPVDSTARCERADPISHLARSRAAS
jgi:hypothetical protein